MADPRDSGYSLEQLRARQELQRRGGPSALELQRQRERAYGQDFPAMLSPRESGFYTFPGRPGDIYPFSAEPMRGRGERPPSSRPFTFGIAPELGGEPLPSGPFTAVPSAVPSIDTGLESAAGLPRTLRQGPAAGGALSLVTRPSETLMDVPMSRTDVTRPSETLMDVPMSRTDDPEGDGDVPTPFDMFPLPPGFTGGPSTPTVPGGRPAPEGLEGDQGLKEAAAEAAKQAAAGDPAVKLVFTAAEIESLFDLASRGQWGPSEEAAFYTRVMQKREEILNSLSSDASIEEQTLALQQLKPLEDMYFRLLRMHQSAALRPLFKQLFPSLNIEALEGMGIPLANLLPQIQSIMGSRPAPSLAPVITSA